MNRPFASRNVAECFCRRCSRNLTKNQGYQTKSHTAPEANYHIEKNIKYPTFSDESSSTPLLFD